MTHMLKYQWNKYSKSAWMLLLVFIAAESILIVNARVFPVFPIEAAMQESMSLFLMFLSYSICIMVVFLQAAVAFHTMLEKTLTRIIPVSGYDYIVSNLILCFLVSMVLSIIALFFLYIFYITAEPGGAMRQSLATAGSLRAMQYITMALGVIVSAGATLSQLYISIAVPKTLPVSKKAQGIIGVVLFFILNGFISLLTFLLEITVRQYAGLQAVYDTASGWSFEILPQSLSVSYIALSIICIAVFLIVSARLIDTKIEG